jgi:hypothetical protein
MDSELLMQVQSQLYGVDHGEVLRFYLQLAKYGVNPASASKTHHPFQANLSHV